MVKVLKNESQNRNVANLLPRQKDFFANSLTKTFHWFILTQEKVNKIMALWPYPCYGNSADLQALCPLCSENPDPTHQHNLVPMTHSGACFLLKSSRGLQTAPSSEPSAMAGLRPYLFEDICVLGLGIQDFLELFWLQIGQLLTPFLLGRLQFLQI